MARPDIICKHRISIVCEGDEEELYIKKLISKSLWNHYSFRVVNAKGAGNVAACYQNEVNIDSSEAVLVFCDTDRNPHQEYKLIKEKLFNIIGDNKADLGCFLIFANPCSMQIILLHFGTEAISLKTQSKHVNADIIEKLTGVAKYKAQEEQINAICNQINRQNYELMKSRAEKLPQSDDEPGSSNFHKFLAYFENDDISWIKNIQKLFGA